MFQQYLMEVVFFVFVGGAVAGSAAVGDKMLSEGGTTSVMFPDPQMILTALVNLF